MKKSEKTKYELEMDKAVYGFCVEQLNKNSEIVRLDPTTVRIIQWESKHKQNNIKAIDDSIEHKDVIHFK